MPVLYSYNYNQGQGRGASGLAPRDEEEGSNQFELNQPITHHFRICTAGGAQRAIRPASQPAPKGQGLHEAP